MKIPNNFFSKLLFATICISALLIGGAIVVKSACSWLFEEKIVEQTNTTVLVTERELKLLTASSTFEVIHTVNQSSPLFKIIPGLDKDKVFSIKANYRAHAGFDLHEGKFKVVHYEGKLYVLNQGWLRQNVEIVSCERISDIVVLKDDGPMFLTLSEEDKLKAINELNVRAREMAENNQELKNLAINHLLDYVKNEAEKKLP